MKRGNGHGGGLLDARHDEAHQRVAVAFVRVGLGRRVGSRRFAHPLGKGFGVGRELRYKLGAQPDGRRPVVRCGQHRQATGPFFLFAGHLFYKFQRPLNKAEKFAIAEIRQ